MHFTQVGRQTGARSGRIALVAWLHVLVALGVVGALNPRTIPLPALPTQAAAPAAPGVQPSTNTHQMRSAVLADADGCAKPDYPMRAARNGETGTVSLALLVGADGKVRQSRIQASSGSRELDRAAAAALSMCRFHPAIHNGVAEAGWAQIAYVWTLE